MQTSPFFATEKRRNQIKPQLFCKLFLHHHKDPDSKQWKTLKQHYVVFLHSRYYDLLSVVYWGEWHPSH